MVLKIESRSRFAREDILYLVKQPISMELAKNAPFLGPIFGKTAIQNEEKKFAEIGIGIALMNTEMKSSKWPRKKEQESVRGFQKSS